MIRGELPFRRLLRRRKTPPARRPAESAAPWEVRRTGSHVVVGLPETIDMANADRVSELLGSVITGGAAIVVVDMTATTFCASAGMSALARAHRLATARECQIRVACASAQVLRILELTAVHKVISTHDSVEAALSAS